MRIQLGELSRQLGGQLQGDPALEISGAATILAAEPGDITFVSQTRFLAQLDESRARAVIVGPGIETDRPGIICEDAEAAFAAVVKRFRPPCSPSSIGISPAAFVSDSAHIGPGVTIYPGASIGDDVSIGEGTVIHANATIMAGCRIGEQVEIFPNVVLYPRTEIGNRTILHAGVVLGAHGFGFRTRDGVHQPGAQLGNVVVGEDVEIGANTTVDRASYDSTTIGDGTKIDDLVMIGHNCRIGKHNLLCSQVGIAGSCETGDYVVMAGQVGIGDHLRIGSRVGIHAKSGVMQNVADDQSILGIPATPVRVQMQQLAAQAKLPEMRRQLRQLIKRIDELESSQQAPERRRESDAA